MPFGKNEDKGIKQLLTLIFNLFISEKSNYENDEEHHDKAANKNKWWNIAHLILNYKDKTFTRALKRINK